MKKINADCYKKEYVNNFEITEFVVGIVHKNHLLVQEWDNINLRNSFNNICLIVCDLRGSTNAELLVNIWKMIKKDIFSCKTRGFDTGLLERGWCQSISCNL